MFDIVPKKRQAKKFLAYLCALFYIAIPSFCLALVIFWFRRHIVPLYIVVPLVLCIVGLIICGLGYDWFFSSKLDVQKDKIIYTYFDILDNKFIYTIKGVEKFRIKGDHLVIFGEVDAKEPYNHKKVKKVKVYYGHCPEIMFELKKKGYLK